MSGSQDGAAGVVEPMDRRISRAFSVVAVSAMLLLGAFTVLAPRGTRGVPAGSESNPLAVSSSFRFAAVGDLGGTGESDMLGVARRTAAAGASFLVALGDLGYAPDEPDWCGSIKGAFNDVELIAGNHDTGASSGGDIAQYVIYCPFTLGVTVTAGPGTPGYGYEYYFDYPASGPLLRTILIAPGAGGSVDYDYSPGTSHYNFVVNAVNDARSRGIPWVAVGGHHDCINAGWYGCEMNQDLFDKLVDLQVDLILNAHYHSYQRSGQLALSAACPTVPSEDRYDADCIVDDGSDGNYSKGAGTIVVINGAGGHGLYSIPLDGSDPELYYMAEVMGGDANSKGLTPGYGPVLYTVTATSLSAETDFCPEGSTDGAGQCPGEVATTFWDRFSIGSPPNGPAARFTFNPASPQVNEAVTFDASPSTDSDPTATLQARWDWEGDGTWDTSLSSSLTAQHTFATPGTYTVRVEILDSNSLSDSTSRQLIVLTTADTTPPVTTATVSGSSGSNGWYTSDVTVTLTATDGDSGVATIHLRMNGGSYQTYTSPVTVSGDGSHPVDYYASDNAGNDEAAHTMTVRIDGAPPVTTAALDGALAGDGSYVGSVNVTLDAVDATSGVQTVRYRIDGGSWTTYSGIALLSGNGTHAFGYFATDNAGNVEGVRSISITITGAAYSAPVTSLSVDGSSGANGWYTSTVDIMLTATGGSGGILTITYRVDGGAGTAYASPLALDEGRHVLEYQASDSMGYVELAKSAVIDVDYTPPVFEDVSPNGTLAMADVTVSWRASDALSGVERYEVSIDGGPFADVGTTRTLTAQWAVGSHAVVVKAFDVAGNSAETTITFQIQPNPTGFDPLQLMPIFLVAPSIVLGLVLAAYGLVRRRHRRRRSRGDRFHDERSDL